MNRTVYFDLHRMLRRLDVDDVAALWREFGPGAVASADPARVDALRGMMPSMLRRVLTREEQANADLLVQVVRLAPTRDVVRPLLAVLMIAPELSVRPSTVEGALVAVGRDAVEPLGEALKGLATFPRTPARVVASLARVLARIGDPRAIDPIVASLRDGAHAQWELLEALHALCLAEPLSRERAWEFVASRASNRTSAIEKGLWPRHVRKGISPLRVRLMRARYARALERWRATDSRR